MPTKTPLTLAEHEDFGAVLTGIRNEILERKVRLENAYARTGADGAAARMLQKAITALDEARCELDRRLHREHPRQATPATYYPGAGGAMVVRRDDVQRLIMAGADPEN
ncbi:hypothetical protein [Kitasatospora sp. NPDC004272]